METKTLDLGGGTFTASVHDRMLFEIDRFDGVYFRVPRTHASCVLGALEYAAQAVPVVPDGRLDPTIIQVRDAGTGDLLGIIKNFCQ